MKIDRKLLCLILSLVMLIAVFAGCSGDKTPSDEEKNASKSVNEDEITPNSSGDTGSSEPTEFDIVTVRWADWGTDFLKNGFVGSLEEKHNVKINWDVYMDSDWSEQKSLMLASSELPDAFFGSICLTDIDIAQNMSSFIKLDDLIEENMPNLSAILANDNTLLSLIKTQDDAIYSLPKKLPLRPETANGLYINKTWLDNLDLSIPKTYLELEEVLQAFYDEDANNNGDPNDEIPYSNTGSLSGDLNNILLPFGTQTSRANYMGLIDGKPTFVPTSENYYKAVQWMHNLYEKKLIDQEYFSQDGSMLDGKTQAEGGALVGIAFGWTADASVGANADDFVIVEALEGPDGSRYVESDPTFLNYGRNELLITTKCENPEILLKWADDFYTDEASLQTYYGSIPDQISENADGTYTVLEPADDASADLSAWTNSFRDFGPKYMVPDFEEKVILLESNGDGIKLKDDEVNREYVKDTYPVVSYTTDQLLEMATLSTDINEYVNSKYAQWVVDGGIEDEWDDYLEQLENMGLSKLIDIHQDAYDVYMETAK